MNLKSSHIIINNSASRVDPFVRKEFTKHKKLAAHGNLCLSAVQGRMLPATHALDTLCAWQTCVAGTSGDTVLTINGVDITVTYATSQTNTAGLLVAAVNSSTTALAYGGRDVEADNRKATFTLTSAAVGCTLTIGQYSLVAVAKAADAYGTWEVSGNDTADAGKLVTAINTYPGLQDLVCASNSAGVVTIFSRRASTPARDLQIKASSEVLSAAVLTASTTVCVSAVRKGTVGNYITCAISGAGTSIAAARLTSGTTTWETI